MPRVISRRFKRSLDLLECLYVRFDQPRGGVAGQGSQRRGMMGAGRIRLSKSVGFLGDFLSRCRAHTIRIRRDQATAFRLTIDQRPLGGSAADSLYRRQIGLPPRSAG